MGRTGLGLLILIVATAGMASAPEPARAGDELVAILKALEKTDDPAVRRQKVLDLAAIGTQRAAGALASLVRQDSAVSVRIDAARALGRVEFDATKMLVELVLRGGPLAVRDAVAESLAARDASPDLLLETIVNPEKPPLVRGLALEALGGFRGPAVVDVLERAGRTKEPFMRGIALRALARHPEGSVVLGPVLAETLRKFIDDDTVLTGLDIATDMPIKDFRPVAEILDSFLSPRVEHAVKFARARMEYAEALERFENERVGTYGSKSPPEPPPSRPRLDVVYVLDATGSVTGHMEKIRERIKNEALLLERVGTDLRAGVVAYRDNERRWSDWMIKALPLTYDRQGVDTFLRTLDTRGSDARGTPVHRGLSAAMERMNWRRGARRQVILIADGRSNDPDAAQAFARMHHDADAITTHVHYLLRTRVRIPDDIRELARVGGGLVEVLD